MMLELVDVHSYYGESYILHGISMEVQRGCVAALLGRTGMGKTTTIRTIIGCTPARSGKVRFKEEDITHLKPYQIARLGIGLIPQGRNIFPSLSVKENLTMAARTVRKSAGWSLEKVYTQFPILESRSK